MESKIEVHYEPKIPLEIQKDTVYVYNTKTGT